MERQGSTVTDGQMMEAIRIILVGRVSGLMERIRVWSLKHHDRFTLRFQRFYLAHPMLLAFQTNVSLLLGMICIWQSKMVQVHMGGSFKVALGLVYIWYYSMFFWKQLALRFRPSRRRGVMTPALRAALHWSLQSLMNFIAGKIQEEAKWADLYASAAFFVLYVHWISFMKMCGLVAEFGVGDSIFTIAVAFVSHLLGGICSNLFLPMFSALLVVYSEIIKLPPPDAYPMDSGDVENEIRRMNDLRLEL